MKILIIKLSAIGDVIHTLPALALLRQSFPESSISWVVEEKAAGILVGHPHLEKVIVSRRKRWISGITNPARCCSMIKEAASFIRELRSDTYDLVIDFQGLFKSALLVLLSRGVHKIGYGRTREFSYLPLTHAIDPPPAETHAVDKNIGLVHALLKLPEVSGGGIPAQKRNVPQHPGGRTVGRPSALADRDSGSGDGIIAPGEREQAHVDAMLRSHHVDRAKPLIVMHAPAGWESKRWEAQKSAALSDRLIARYDAHIIFTGAAADAPPIDAIISLMKKSAVNAAGRTTLRELACLIKCAQLCVTTDSGPMHLAAALGTPIVALFGPTAPWRTGPYKTRARIVRKGLPCSPCYKRQCDSMACMKEIGVDEVMDAAVTLMNGPTDASSYDADK